MNKSRWTCPARALPYLVHKLWGRSCRYAICDVCHKTSGAISVHLQYEMPENMGRVLNGTYLIRVGKGEKEGMSSMSEWMRLYQERCCTAQDPDPDRASTL